MDRDDIDFELREIDEQILDLLEEGRQTRQNLASVLDVTGEYIYQRVDLLLKLGVVEKIHDGFYELHQETDEPLDAIESVPQERQGDDFEDDAFLDAELPDELEQEIERFGSELRRAGTDHVDDRVAAARAVGRMLVAEDGVSRSQAIERLLPEYSVSGQEAETWWQKAGKERFSRIDSVEWSQTEQQYVVVE